MNLGFAAATFILVIPAELPDKTFISAVVLGARYRPFPVWIGAASGLILQAGIAVVAGGLLTLLPHRAVDAVVAALFIAGAVFMLVSREQQALIKGAEVAGEEGAVLDSAASKKAVADNQVSAVRIAATTFGIVALAEFGDLTQILIANLAARFRDPTSVFGGAAVAFVAISAVGAFGGSTLTRVVPLGVVRKVSGLALAVLGVLSATNAAR